MITTYFKNLIANSIWNTSAKTELPTTFYLALSITPPASDGTGVSEPDASIGYARIEIPVLTTANDGQVTNSETIAWAKTTLGIEVPVTHWCVFDAQTDGNLLIWEALDKPIYIDSNMTLAIDKNALILRVLGA